MEPIKILIADDHTVLRSGLRLLLDRQPDFDVVGEAGTGAETVERAIALQPDVLLLDIGMPDLNGLEAARRIRHQAPEVRIIVLTMYDDEAYLCHFLELGAAGYVLKRAADTELAVAIRAVYRGESFVYPSSIGGLIDSHKKQPSSPDTSEGKDGLSHREMDVLRVLALGHTNQQIGDELCIGVSTVGTYRMRIMEKLGLRGRAQLVRYALDRGLVKIPTV